MDDFDVVLGIKFIRKHRAITTPWVNALLMMGEKPCVIQGRSSSSKDGIATLSAIQFKKGLKKGEPSLLCAIRAKESKGSLEEGSYPEGVEEILWEFRDVMPEKLPKGLPPRRAVDHQIELLPGTKPPARAPYRMDPPE